MEVKTTVTEQKNLDLETAFEANLETIAIDILKNQGLVLRDRDQRHYVKNLLRYRSTPGQEGKKHYAHAEYSEMATNFIFPSISRKQKGEGIVEEKGEKIKRESEVVVTHRERQGSEWTSTVDIFYPAAETVKDRMYLQNLQDTRNEYAKKLGISLNPRDKVNIFVHLMYPSNITPDRELPDITESAPDNLGVTVKVIECKVPFSTEQMFAIDREVDKRKTELDHPGKKYLEIREVTVNKELRAALTDLPDGSLIRKLAVDNEDRIAKYIYESLKTYGLPNMEDASGYLFEALFLLELQGTDKFKGSDRLHDAIWSEINSGRQIPSGELDFSSQDFNDLNQDYQDFFSTKALSHADFLIPENINGKKVISALLECKSSPSPVITEANIHQTSKSVRNLPSFVESLPNHSDFIVPTEKTTKVLIIKPSIDGVKDKVTIMDGIYIKVVRSDIRYEELMSVWNKIALKE